MDRLEQDLVDQLSVAEGNGRLGGQTLEPIRQLRRDGQPLGIGRHAGDDEADGVPRHADRRRHGRHGPQMVVGMLGKVTDALHEPVLGDGPHLFQREDPGADRHQGLVGVSMRGDQPETSVAGSLPAPVVEYQHDLIAVDDVGDRPDDLRRHLLGAHDLGQGPGQLQENLGRVGLIAGLLQRIPRIQGGSGQAAIGLQGVACLGGEDAAVSADGEHAVVVAGGHDVHDIHIVAPGTPRQQVVGDAGSLRLGETVGVDLARATRCPGLQGHQCTAGAGRPHRRSDDALENVFVALVRSEIGHHALQLVEPGLEQLRAHLEVLGTGRRLVTLDPSKPEETGTVAPALALLFDDLCRLETEEERYQRILPGRELAVLGVGSEPVDEVLTDRPLGRSDFGRLIAPDRNHGVGVGGAGEDIPGGAEGLDRLGDLRVDEPDRFSAPRSRPGGGVQLDLRLLEQASELVIGTPRRGRGELLEASHLAGAAEDVSNGAFRQPGGQRVHQHVGVQTRDVVGRCRVGIGLHGREIGRQGGRL